MITSITRQKVPTLYITIVIINWSSVAIFIITINGKCSIILINILANVPNIVNNIVIVTIPFICFIK